LRILKNERKALGKDGEIIKSKSHIIEKSIAVDDKTVFVQNHLL